MDTRDRGHWDSLVYKMLYPGILGSMIYSFMDMLCRNNSCRRSLLIAQGLVILFYCLDYLHLYNDLLERLERSASCRNLVLDVLITWFFGFTSCCILYENLRWAWIFLLALSVAICFYNPPNIIKTGSYRKSTGVLALLVLFFAVLSWCVWCFKPGTYFPIFLGLCTAWYCVHIFYITECVKNKKPCKFIYWFSHAQ